MVGLISVVNSVFITHMIYNNRLETSVFFSLFTIAEHKHAGIEVVITQPSRSCNKENKRFTNVDDLIGCSAGSNVQ